MLRSPMRDHSHTGPRHTLLLLYMHRRKDHNVCGLMQIISFYLLIFLQPKLYVRLLYSS